jgi:alpha/beta superfamily hydrolase
MKEQLKETLTKFVTIKTEEQKRRLIAGFSFGGLCGLMAAIGGIEYLFISGMFAIVYATGLVGGYYIYTKHQHKETVEE